MPNRKARETWDARSRSRSYRRQAVVKQRERIERRDAGYVDRDEYSEAQLDGPRKHGLPRSRWIQSRLRLDLRWCQLAPVQSDIENPASEIILSTKTDPKGIVDAQVIFLGVHARRFRDHRSIDKKFQIVLAAHGGNVMPA